MDTIAPREFELNEVIQKLRDVDAATGFPKSILLGFSDVSAQSEHLARYMFASKWAKGVVLDIATGSGYGASILANNRFNFVVAADIDILGLSYGKRIYNRKNIYWIQCDAAHLPFRDLSFDMIVSIETLEHVNDQETTVQEFNRIMKNQAILLISTPNKTVTSPMLSTPLNPYHNRDYGLKEIQKIGNGNIEINQFFVQTRIDIKWAIARFFSIPIVSILRKAGFILHLRKILSKFRNQIELLDPNPSLYPISVFSRSTDCLTHFQLVAIGRKTNAMHPKNWIY